jgi:hypothetical protein
LPGWPGLALGRLAGFVAGRLAGLVLGRFAGLAAGRVLGCWAGRVLGRDEGREAGRDAGLEAGREALGCVRAPLGLLCDPRDMPPDRPPLGPAKAASSSGDSRITLSGDVPTARANIRMLRKNRFISKLFPSWPVPGFGPDHLFGFSIRHEGKCPIRDVRSKIPRGKINAVLWPTLFVRVGADEH